MVSNRFFTIILVVGTVLKLCNGSACCHDTSRDLNKEWRAADVLEQLGHDVYQSLALGPFDANDPEKRFFSVYGQALFQYLISKAPTEAGKIHEAVRKTRKQLQKPAHVLAGPMRGAISMMFTYIELPLTDIQQACPYDACEADCQKNLAKLKAQRIKTCPGYKHNIAMYSLAVKFVTSCGLTNVLKHMLVAVQTNNPSDKAALAFFSSTALLKYPEAVQLFRKIFDYMNTIPKSQSCTIFSFL